VKFTGEVASDAAGNSVASAGDVNNDGYDDILIGARGNDFGGASAGAVYLIYGQAAQLDGGSLGSAWAKKFTGENASSYAGWSVNSAGDVNNDGYYDMLIGAYANSDAAAYAGAAYLIYGQSGTLAGGSLSTAVEFTGEAEYNYAGIAVASAGDVNNDGYDDMLVGATDTGDASLWAGWVYLIYGQSANFVTDISLSTAIKFIGKTASDNTGLSVGSAGDVNNDGYDDILIGALRNDDTGVSAGATYLIYGQSAAFTTGTSLSTAIEFTGEVAGDLLGNFVASAGDVNNDGFADIILGGPNNDDAASNAGAAYLSYLYIDVDGDGRAGATGLFTGTDCNDADATVYANQTYYRDADLDGLGDLATTSVVCSMTVTAGYVTNSTDTNDNDYDNDGSIIGTDCNDADATVHSNQTYYRDADLDGLGDLATTSVVCSMTVTAGYVTNSTDTNDNDYDNDGSIIGTDCNDADATISANQTYYKDGDQDGLGNPDITVSICSYTVPIGYVTNDNEKYNGPVQYVTGTKQGPGTISIYDNNNVLIKQWDAFNEGGVIVRLVNIKRSTYVLALKRRSGSSMHMYTTTGDVLEKIRLSPELHWRQPAIGNLNSSTDTEEFVISARRGATLYLRVYSFNTRQNTFSLLKETSYHYVRHSYRVEIKNKTVEVLINGTARHVFTWTPLSN
ncbi:MAG: integrin alpha, partial [Patescibacteria group bacterium]